MMLLARTDKIKKKVFGRVPGAGIQNGGKGGVVADVDGDLVVGGPGFMGITIHMDITNNITTRLGYASLQ